MSEPRPMKKMTIRLFEDDLAYLRSAYQGTGYNTILRSLASRHVRKLRHATQDKLAHSGAIERLTPEELGLA